MSNLYELNSPSKVYIYYLILSSRGSMTGKPGLQQQRRNRAESVGILRSLFFLASSTDQGTVPVALEEIVLIDLTLNELFRLDYGEQAKRNAIDDKWERSKAISEE